MFRLDCSTDGSYPIVLTSGVFDPTNRALAEALDGRRCLVVVDPDVDRLYGAALHRYLGSLPEPAHVMVCTGLSERRKTIDTVLEVCAAAQEADLGRRDVVVALGGGVCCDVVSVAASLIRRGIHYVCVPTTLLAQVDAGIGLKGGVNFGDRKNYLGCFEPPRAVLVDPELVRTQSARQLRCGLAEVMKMALVRDAALFERLRDDGPRLVVSSFVEPPGVGAYVIARSAQLMLQELGQDCYERGALKRLVDFGHTFSGRLEEASGYMLPHGEAVAVDMVLSCAVGVELSLLPEAALRQVVAVFVSLGLTVSSPWSTPALLRTAMEGAVSHRDGSLNLVVPTGIGTATFVTDIETVTDEVLERAVARTVQFEGPGELYEPCQPVHATDVLPTR